MTKSPTQDSLKQNKTQLQTKQTKAQQRPSSCHPLRSSSSVFHSSHCPLWPHAQGEKFTTGSPRFSKDFSSKWTDGFGLIYVPNLRLVRLAG